MKFKYLKLTLLMATVSVTPLAMHAETCEIVSPNKSADVEGAAKLLLELTDTEGAKKSIDQTKAIIDQIIDKLQGDPKYKETSDALHELKTILVKFEKTQAEGVLGRVTGQLQDMYHALSDGMKSQLNARLEKLKTLSAFAQAKLLNKLGVSLWKK
jgi:hypothetical protein